MPRVLPLLCAALGTVLPAVPAAARTFTNTEGKTVEAEIVRVQDDKIMLRLTNRRSVTIPLNTLSEADRDYVTQWQADRIPRLRFDPKMVRKTDTEKYGGVSSTYRTGVKRQTLGLEVEVRNEETAKGLEESTMRYILVGRSVADDKTHKILSIQSEDFTVPAAGRKTVRFREVINEYRDSPSPPPSPSPNATTPVVGNFKVIGYLLHVERRKDQREVHTFASTRPLEEALNLVLALEEGDLANEAFLKIEPVKPLDKQPAEGPIIIR